MITYHGEGRKELIHFRVNVHRSMEELKAKERKSHFPNQVFLSGNK